MFDSVGLQGDYSAGITIGPNQLVNIDVLAFLSSTDGRFGTLPGTLFSYHITMDDGNVAAGESLIVSSNALIVGETFTFDGSAETDGFYRIFSGNGGDIILGSQGADTISGRGGADTLTGNGGDDVFLYSNVSESVLGTLDQITDFTTGDLINLAGIDADMGAAGNQAFTFISTAAFSGVAGQLRVVNTGGNDWIVQAVFDGDALEEMRIQVTTSDGNPLDASDFVL